jgi:hypothetical protein
LRRADNSHCSSYAAFVAGGSERLGIGPREGRGSDMKLSRQWAMHAMNFIEIISTEIEKHVLLEEGVIQMLPAVKVQ